MCGTTRPAGAGMMNIVSLCNESCLTSQPDKQVLWCGQDRHVGSNLVTIHHNRMLQTAEKRHNPCNSDHILGHVQFQNKSWIQNFKFSVYIHMPPLSSHNRIRNSNSFICIPRVPPSMCFWTWLFTASMCVCVCVVGKYFKHWRGSLFCLTESQLCQKFMMSLTTTQHHPMRIIADGVVCVWHFD